MLNNNAEDRAEMAQEIAEVRKGATTNMFDKNGVVRALMDLGYDYTAEYILNNKNNYMNLLKASGKY